MCQYLTRLYSLSLQVYVYSKDSVAGLDRALHKLTPTAFYMHDLIPGQWPNQKQDHLRKIIHAAITKWNSLVSVISVGS